MTPTDDDDLPPSPRETAIPLMVWVVAGAVLVLAFCMAVIYVRRGV